MPHSPPFLAWTMPEIADHVVCEKFEANMFAKSRCKNCFRTVAAHQSGRQEPEKNEVKIPNSVASTDGSISHDPLDPLCILVPQCELYVCLGSEEKTEICKENVVHAQLSCRAQEESQEAGACLDAKTTPWTNGDTNDTLSRDWEMTRILDNILRSDREDMMYYAGQKQEHNLLTEEAHFVLKDGREWYKSCRRALLQEIQKPIPEISSILGLMGSPIHLEGPSLGKIAIGFRAVSQDLGGGKRKRQAESDYFSLEQGKSEPTWASSPPRGGCGTLPARGESPGVGGRRPSSASSADSDLSWRLSGTSCEGRQGLMRQEYTVLADLPKAKRLNHRQAFDKDRRSPRTQSPGRVEVERIFGPERRKSETLEAFQALEEGLLERLDSKSLKLAKEKQLVRRQSSPTLRRDVNKRFPQDSGQPSRHGGESLRLGRSDQRRERFGSSRGQSLPSGSPPQGLERESRSRGVPLQSSTSLSQHVERERRRPEEAVQNLRAGGERAVLRSKDYRKPMTDGGAQRQLVETSCSKPSGKSPEAKWKSCLNALHAANPTKNLDEGRGGPRRTLERYKENDRKARGKPLLPVGTTKCLSEDTKDCQYGIRTFNLGRGTTTGERGGRVLSPPRLQEVSWGNQREAKRPISPGRETGISERRHGAAGRVFSPGRCTSGSQRQTGLSLSPGRGRESSEKPSREAGRSPSPGKPMEVDRRVCRSQASCHSVAEQPLQPCWKSHREPAAAQRNQGLEGNWPPKSEPSPSFAPRRGNDWKLCSQTSSSTHLPATDQRRTGQGQIPCSVRPESGPQTQEGLLCHVHPMQLLEREWLGQGDYLNSVKPGQRPQGESHWRSRGSPLGEMKEDERQNDERCSSPRRLEKQARHEWNNEEKLSYQHQLDGAKPLKSYCSLRNQDIYLDTSKIQKPDLLNFKKGWMSILEKPGEWTKHWFVLTDSSLRYYRDSNAEEADDLDGEIDLRSCTDVTEFAVQRNYGFQIHTKDAVFTLSAMTSGIRRNWIEALRKSIRPVSVPDVTKLSDCNKENTFRSYGSPRSPFRSEEQRPAAGPEVIPKGGGSSRKADGQRHAFDYVELSPLGSLQRTRGSTRATEGKREELERDLAVRQEERRKWFESPASGVLQTDGPAGEIGPKTGVQNSGGTPLTETQKHRLSEEIEKKWQELERLPLKDSKRVPLMALLNQGKGGRQDTNEALEKEVQLLRSQLESLSAQKEAKLPKDAQIPRGYISQDACERSLAEMENSHRQVMAELQRHHQREMERLQQEKHRLLSEEAAATAAAIEALKKAHQEELKRELSRTRSFQKGDSDTNTLQQQHQSDVESLKRELQVLSEQYSQKCLQIGDLVQKAEDQEQTLQHCQQEGKELLRQNQELQRRLSEEIGQLRAFITAQSSPDGVSHNKERNSCELEVLLRVKENELQYLKQEVQCLRDELHMMQKDKRFASGKYQDVYAELNDIKRRSEREIEHLKEHLRLTMAALQEKEMLHNSIG